MYEDILDVSKVKNDSNEDENYVLFNNLMDNLILLNKKNRNKVLGCCFSSYKAYLKEHCTICLGINRGIGKTRYIFENAKIGDVIVVTNHTYKCTKIPYIVNCKADMLTFNDLINKKFNCDKYYTIWVNDLYGEFAHKYEINEVKNSIYDSFASSVLSKYQTFIFLG